MKDFANEEKQLENIKSFHDAIGEGEIDSFLSSIWFTLAINVSNLETVKINGKTITEYEIYNSHKEIYEKICSETISISNPLSALGFTNEEINALTGEEKNPDRILKIISDKYNLKIGTENSQIDESELEKKLLLNMTANITPEMNRNLMSSIYFTNDEINRVLNGIDDYLEIDFENKTESKPTSKKYKSLKLYGDAYEIYMKILKEICLKSGVNINRTNNTNLYQFIRKKYPLLLESANKLLRNDICHLNYDEREKYSVEELDEERNIILVKAITYIVVLTNYILNYFYESTNMDKRIEKHISKIVSEVTKQF
jgi:hypothetical protein